MKYVIQNCWTNRTWFGTKSEARFFAGPVMSLQYNVYLNGFGTPITAADIR